MLVKKSGSDLAFDIVNYTILGLILLAITYPLYFILISSVSSPDAVFTGRVWLWPIDTTVNGYRKIFNDQRIWVGYRNTVFYTLVGSFINVSLTMLMAYPLSRRTFSGKKAVMVYLFITMYFSGGLIPTFLLVKSLGLYNQWPVMVILGAVQVWNVIIARTFLQSNIPEEMYEAALMEGANHWVFFRKIVLPLSQAIIAVLFLFYGVAHWNDFFRGLIYLDNSDLYPLQLNLRSILLQVETANNMVDQESMNEQVMLSALIKYGTIVVTALPVLVLYPFLQRYFVQGVLIGSLKG